MLKKALVIGGNCSIGRAVGHGQRRATGGGRGRRGGGVWAAALPDTGPTDSIFWDGKVIAW
jgi:hypothetical protein